MNQLILGDCLEVMKLMDSESVDLIYLDPPFFSNRNYEVIWGDKGEVRSFEDRWSGGVDHYIAWLKERVVEMHRLLKPTGSIYLHCDWHANSHIRVFILEKIFGYNNFRGEIIWQRTNIHNDAKKKLAVLTDTIWYFSKNDDFIYNPIYGEYNEKYLKSFYKHEDEKGKYSLGDLTNTKPGPYNYDYKGFKPNVNGWRCPIETMERWDNEGLIYFPEKKNQRLRLKRYLKEEGTLLGNIWNDINNVQGAARIGYPTQKPEKLLERIILASSNEDEVVLDPFVGGGTTVAVADRLKRKWIGIDQSVAAIKVSEMRLNKQQNLFSEPFSVTLHKYDYDTLRYKDAFEFEKWIVERFGGFSNAKQRNDFGMDGRTRENVPIQVKRSDNIGRNVVDNFHSALMRFDKSLYEKNKEAGLPAGYIIAFSFGKGAIQEVARLKNEEGILISLVTVEEIVPIAKKPKLTVSFDDRGTDGKGLREIEFKAVAESECGIEMYSWDFDFVESEPFKAEVLIDREGSQSYKFKPGQHTIAVKAVDAEGLEALEIIRLKVNGEVVKG